MASVTHPVQVNDTHQKTTAPTLQKEADTSFGNFHANQMNAGSSDDSEQKISRIKAMKRRMSKPY